MQCKLDKELHDCPFLIRETDQCKNENKCTYQEKEEKKNCLPPEKKDKWYEKYYK